MKQGETIFLRHLLLACGTAESKRLDEKLCEAQSHERCVLRGMWWVSQLILLTLAGLGYTAVLLQDISDEGYDFLIRLFSRIGFGSAISLAGFFCLWLGYRKQLSRQRKECRHFITRILHSCAERSPSTLLPLPLGRMLEYPTAEQRRQSIEF
jgi:hypothetical protein